MCHALRSLIPTDTGSWWVGGLLPTLPVCFVCAVLQARCQCSSVRHQQKQPLARLLCIIPARSTTNATGSDTARSVHKEIRTRKLAGYSQAYTQHTRTSKDASNRSSLHTNLHEFLHLWASCTSTVHYLCLHPPAHIAL